MRCWPAAARLSRALGDARQVHRAADNDHRQENGLFEPFIYKKSSFYQHRLGINIRENSKKARFVLQPIWSLCRRHRARNSSGSRPHPCRPCPCTGACSRTAPSAMTPACASTPRVMTRTSCYTTKRQTLSWRRCALLVIHVKLRKQIDFYQDELGPAIIEHRINDTGLFCLDGLCLRRRTLPGPRFRRQTFIALCWDSAGEAATRTATVPIIFHSLGLLPNHIPTDCELHTN